MGEQNAEVPSDREREWSLLRRKYLVDPSERQASSAQGIHHLALLSSDVERTIEFYQGVLFENRDYSGSTHFFFDLGNGNALAFFDFPGLEMEPYKEVLGSLHHLAISVPLDTWKHLRVKLETAGIEIAFEHAGSIYFNGPDGERLELLAEPLGEMNGRPVL